MTLKSELIARIADDSGQTKLATTAVLEAFENAILDDISAGYESKILGIGKIVVKDVAERNGRNPSTGESIRIAARKKPSFVFAKAAKEAAN